MTLCEPRSRRVAVPAACVLVRNEQLLHPQGSAVVRASCDPLKPHHAPYLKPQDGSSSCKGAWGFETETRMKGGVVMWDTPLRIRHLASGKYLAVDALPIEGGKMLFPCTLVDWKDVEADPTLISRIRFVLQTTW